MQKLREACVTYFGARDADVDRFSGALDGDHLLMMLAMARDRKRVAAPRESAG